MMTTATEDNLLSALRLPDIESPVRLLYENYFESLVSYICKNGGSEEDGADIFQEAVLVLTCKVKTGQFREESSVKTFLFSIARNLWLHEQRTRKRRISREEIYMQTEAVEESERVFAKEGSHRQMLNEVMQKIGDGCKKLLHGFYYENKSVRELQLQFAYQNDQVLRNRKSKCLKKLKELITERPALLNHLKY